MTIQEKLAERKRLLDEAKAIQAKADEENRNLSEEEEAAINANLKAAGTLKSEIEEERETAERQAQLRASIEAEESWESQAQPRKTKQAALGAGVRITGGEAASGFAHFGEFLHSVRMAAFSDADHARLEGKLRAAVSGAGTTVDAELGFLVPREYSTRILERMRERGSIINLPFLQMPLSGNALDMPYINQTSRADGSRSGGVLGYWVGEAEAPTGTNPTIGQLSLKLHKAGCLGYVTEELMSDAPATGALMERLFAKELLFKVEDAIVRGDGSKKPMGLINAKCKIAVAKETNQTATSLWGANVVKMWARRNPGSGSQNVWLVNQDVEPQLWGLTLEGRYGSAATAVDGIPLYYPANSATNQGKYGILMGRPVIPCEYCSTLGTAGDIILFDPAEYVLATKAGAGISVEDSIHVRFSQGERTFRAFFRVDGQPGWSSAETPYQGTSTLSPIVTLAARA